MINLWKQKSKKTFKVVSNKFDSKFVRLLSHRKTIWFMTENVFSISWYLHAGVFLVLDIQYGVIVQSHFTTNRTISTNGFLKSLSMRYNKHVEVCLRCEDTTGFKQRVCSNGSICKGVGTIPSGYIPILVTNNRLFSNN